MLEEDQWGRGQGSLHHSITRGQFDNSSVDGSSIGCLNIVKHTLGTLLISFRVQYSEVTAGMAFFLDTAASSLKLKESMHINDL